MTSQARRAWRVGAAFVLVAWGLGFVAPPGAAAQDPVVPSHLVQRAATAGSVRLIVQVGAAVGPEAMLADDHAVATQRQLIGSAQSFVLSRLAGLSHRPLRQYTTVPFLAVEGGPDVLQALESLRGLVVTVEEDRLHRPTLAESGPLVQATTTWGAGFDGTGQVVAILDTGVDKTHSFLAGKVVEEACFSGNASCPNLGTVQIGPGAGVPCTYAPSDCQHGTHVAGIAAGRGTTFSGVARGAQIMAVQVFSRFTGASCDGPPTCALAFTSDILAGLDRVNDIRGTRSFASVNLSLGGGAPTPGCDSSQFAMKAMIDSLRAAGIATVVASGNDGATTGLSAPACISSAISVGSTRDGGFGGTPVDRVSPFSNSAFTLSLLAPGEVTMSSVPGGGFANFLGTSMATPHVAGAWALLKQANPTATVSQILTILQSTGVPVADFRNGITKSRIRIFSALTAMAPPPNVCSTALTNFENGDYDGDGRADVVLYRTSDGTWLIRRSSNGALQQVPWGSPPHADLPVPGSYTEGGALARTDVAVYRRSTGVWYIHRATDAGLTQVAWGAPALGDTPALGDYDGDGKTDIAVFRRTTGEWFILRSLNGTLVHLAWGAPSLGDVPVPGDYDGDGKTDIAVFRRATGEWFILRSTDGMLAVVPWGAPSLDDVPVPGNYTQAGTMARTDIAVYRRSTGVWYIRRATDGGLTQISWGAPALGDVAGQGDYDGDGRTDVAVYRTRTGEWLIRRSSDGALFQVSWGTPSLGDTPPGCR